VSISKHGTLSLNASATGQFLDGATHAVLMYDAETRQIAIKPVDKTTGDAYRLSRPKGGGVHIAAKRFLAHIGYPHTETKRLDISWNDEVKAVVIALT